MNIGEFHNVFTDVRQHARQQPQIEVCGLLLRDRKKSTRAVPVKNWHSNPKSNFEISARDMLAHQSTLFGIWHSHPVGQDTQLSPQDKRTSEMLGVPILAYIHETDSFDYYRPASMRARLTGREFLFGVQDCVAVVRDWLHDVRGLTLNLLITSPRQIIRGLDDWHGILGAIGLRASSEPVPNSVVTMSYNGTGRVDHCGILLDEKRFIHQVIGCISEEVVFTEGLRHQALEFWQ